MSKKSNILFFAALAIASPPSHAQERTSADYQIEHEVEDAGGGEAASADYSEVASGGAGGGSASGAGGVELSHGFTGGLYELVSLSLAASPETVDEQGTRQLESSGVADDGTTVMGIDGISFSIDAGPLVSVDGAGRALADVVFQDSMATVRGQFGLLSDVLELTVLDSIDDNFGSYSGDGLPDDWQVGFFGVDNPEAEPGRDPDGDGQDNNFEFVAGVDPSDVSSVFESRVEVVPGTEMRRLVFSPVRADRNYSPFYSNDLAAAGWLPLMSFTVGELPGGEGVFTDTETSSGTRERKFYKIRIETTTP